MTERVPVPDDLPDERDERLKIDMDPEEALRVLLTTPPKDLSG